MKNIELIAAMILLPILYFTSSCISKEYPVTGTYTDTEYRTEYISETITENETTVDSITASCELQPFYTWYSQNVAFNGQTNFWYLAYDIDQSPPYDNLRLKVSIWKQFQYETASVRILDMSKGGHLSIPDPAIYGDTDEGRVQWTWITPSTTATLALSDSSDSMSGDSSEEAAVLTTGGASTTWLDMANIQINQSRFLGGRTNLWSKPENPQVLDLDAGKAQKIGIIICGPQSQWNARVTLEGTFRHNVVSYETVTRDRQEAKQVPYEVQKQVTTYETRQVPFWEMFSR